MRENYGLYCFWDVDNNCFIASSPDYVLCRGAGVTRVESVAALDTEVQEWIQTGRGLGVDVSYAPPMTREQVSIPLEVPSPSEKVIPEQPKRKKGGSSLKALKEALAAAQEAASSYPLDFTVTFDPCLIRIRGEMSLQTASGARDEILALALHQSKVIFDLSEVGFIDSYGLALLVEIRKRLRFPNASLCIVVSGVKGDQVERVLRLGRFDTIMHLCLSLEEATAISQGDKLTS